MPRERFRRVWVGADDELVHPQPPPTNERLRVFMYASFIPLHGLEYVVQAAALLETADADVEFDIIGTGLTERAVRELAEQLRVRSVRFHEPRPYQTLVQAMAASDVCLGIFGTSPKTARVIPNKVYDALAAARPVITADTTAAREALTHRDTAWLCRPGDAEALADAITQLHHDVALRTEMAQRGHRAVPGRVLDQRDRAQPRSDHLRSARPMTTTSRSNGLALRAEHRADQGARPWSRPSGAGWR